MCRQTGGKFSTDSQDAKPQFIFAGNLLPRVVPRQPRQRRLSPLPPRAGAPFKEMALG